MRILFVCLFFIGYLTAKGQYDNSEKTILNLLASNMEHKKKIDSANFIIENNFKQNYLFYDSIAHAVLKISETNFYKFGEASAMLNIASIDEGTGKLNRAEQSISKAIVYFKAMADSKAQVALAKSYLVLGDIYRRTGKKGDATNAYLETVRIAERQKTPYLIASGYRGLGITYVLEQDYQKAFSYFYRAIGINKKINHKLNLSANYTNLGIVFLRLKQYDKSLAAHQQALKLALELKNQSRISFVYNDIGATSLYKGDYATAIYYLQKSIAIREQIHEMNEIAYTYNYLGEVYNKMGNFALAEKWIQKALATAIEINNNKQHYEALESLSDFYASNKKYNEAYTYLSKYKVYRDSIANIERKEAIDELITRYETEKKEEQIKILNQKSTIQKLQLKQKNVVILVIISVLIFGAILAYLFYSRKQLKAKAILQQEINKQQDLAARAVLDAEERERRRIAGDLHDGVGQLLSASLMNLNGLFKKLNLSSDQALQAEQSLALVNESYDEMRSISHQMMPNALIKSGLASAIKEFLSKIDQDVIKVSLETVGLNQRLDEQKETVLYRIIQETVNNVIKHAEATKLNIVLIKDDEGVSATIEDNGKGFEKSSLKEGIGISNMQSRIEFLKGTLDIDTAMGKGTLVAVFIPN